jgi:cytochrome bd-type quinol oxidase subunit 1
VPRWAYFASTLMVALGTTFSAFWIMANNTWMQVPVGLCELVGGDTVPTDWAAILFNDVLWVRFPHMLLGAYLTTAFCVAATGAWYLLAPPPPARRANDAGDGARGIAAVLTPAQIGVGHLNGEYTAEHQPAQVHRHRGSLADRAAGATAAVRLAGHRSGAQPLRARHSVPRQLRRPGQLQRRGARHRHGARGRAPAVSDPVLRVPHHGRARA